MFQPLPSPLTFRTPVYWAHESSSQEMLVFIYLPNRLSWKSNVRIRYKYNDWPRAIAELGLLSQCMWRCLDIPQQSLCLTESMFREFADSSILPQHSLTACRSESFKLAKRSGEQQLLNAKDTAKYRTMVIKPNTRSILIFYLVCKQQMKFIIC